MGGLNGHLLNIRSFGPSVVQGTVSGNGGLALEGGQLHIDANATYSGKTWVHFGDLRVDGDIRTSEKLVFGPSASLTGHGKLPLIDGRGLIDPDGILEAASVTPAPGIAFHFKFASDVPTYASASTSSNDLLRLTGSPAISAPLTSASTGAVYLASAPSPTATTLRGGFFFDDATTSSSLITGATWQVLVADPAGEMTHDGTTYAPLDRSWTISLTPIVPALPAVVDSDVDGVGNAELLEVAIAAEPDEARRFARLKVDFAN